MSKMMLAWNWGVLALRPLSRGFVGELAPKVYIPHPYLFKDGASQGHCLDKKVNTGRSRCLANSIVGCEMRKLLKYYKAGHGNAIEGACHLPQSRVASMEKLAYG